MPGQKIDPLLLSEDLGAAHHQILYGTIRVRDVVRHSAGAVGNVLGFFQHGNRKIGLVAFGAAGRAHSGGIASDNHKIHDLPPF